MLGKFGGFILQTKQELNKVTWPTLDEVRQATAVTIIATGIVAAFIAICDLVLSTIMRIVLG